ncbi:MAG: acyl carrier protein [Bacteroidetes bacterium CG02_land_8_20_14_3_00_31_25]|nr:acyl carrier protein [Bacteroidota bacterium]OFX37299.1 MAG: acyl carrier protein [Bacteroidetes bacterium GWA2_32_17]PIV58032.1 MAG: acyl carrier protein [Bacteroidetes bacterium CG02_land_8_20_14_3_00_31_25]PIX35695.1 MAG: acyl carrier protein [Bacteroidetes bacterium CG_4_8_14_3_um_filter_31_14]PIY02072.1 MAG: acyl carrier protein [Bacteroidetes bacterium CG_4_10_14_3_um_filter_31_20]
MVKEEVIKIINNFLIEEFELNPEQIKPEARLKDDLGLESLDFVDIAVVVEKEFKFKVKGEEMTEVRTLDDLYNYIFKTVNLKTN